MKTKRQIIREAFDYVKKHGRALSENDSPVYLNEKGKVCTHSFFIKEEFRPKIMKITKEEGLSPTAMGVIRMFGDEVHKEEYQNHSIDFWEDIQSIHDKSWYWDGKSLTDKGKVFYNNLIKSYSDESF